MTPAVEPVFLLGAGGFIGWTPRVSLDTGLERTWQWLTRQA